ncbi:MAG: hypothetical protein R2880_12405 [Deinococcales bacterium]
MLYKITESQCHKGFYSLNLSLLVALLLSGLMLGVAQQTKSFKDYAGQYQGVLDISGTQLQALGLIELQSLNALSFSMQLSSEAGAILMIGHCELTAAMGGIVCKAIDGSLEYMMKLEGQLDQQGYQGRLEVHSMKDSDTIPEAVGSFNFQPSLQMVGLR